MLLEELTKEQLQTLINNAKDKLNRRQREETETLVNQLFEIIEKLAAIDKNGICVQTPSTALTWMGLEQNIFSNYYF